MSLTDNIKGLNNSKLIENCICLIKNISYENVYFQTSVTFGKKFNINILKANGLYLIKYVSKLNFY